MKASSPEDADLGLLARDLREIGFSAHFLTESGILSGSFGVAEKECTYAINSIPIPTYPRQFVREISIFIPVNLSKRRAEALVKEIPANWIDDGLRVRVVDETVKSASLSISVLFLGNADERARKDGLTALTSAAKALYEQSLVAVVAVIVPKNQRAEK